MKRIVHWFVACTVVRVRYCNVRPWSELSSLKFPSLPNILDGGVPALLFVTLALSSPAQAWRVECKMWHLHFSMDSCFLIPVASSWAASVVLCLKDTPRPPSGPPERAHSHLCCSAQRLQEQRLVPEWWESWGPALPTDGRPVGLYRSRTDAALAAARRLSLWTALSGSDLWSCHPPGMRFPGTPAASPGPGLRHQTGDSLVNKPVRYVWPWMSAGGCGMTRRPDGTFKYRCQPASFSRVLSEKAALELVMWPQRSSFLVLALMSLWRARGGAKWTGGLLHTAMFTLRQSCFYATVWRGSDSVCFY